MTGSIQAFIAFLKCEANQAEARANALRRTAAAIEANISSNERPRKRVKPNDSRRKLSHSSNPGYALYVQENYDTIKEQLHLEGHEDSNKATLAITAQRWTEAMDDPERQAWEVKADQLKQEGVDIDAIDSFSESGMLETTLKSPPEPSEGAHHMRVA